VEEAASKVDEESQCRAPELVGTQITEGKIWDTIYFKSLKDPPEEMQAFSYINIGEIGS